MSAFDRALKIVLASEGGYVDDSADPGGKTRYGITEVVARAHGYTGPMEKLPLELAKRIYRESYWNVIRGDELPWPMSALLFDQAVNSGPVQAIRTLQRSLKVPVDGILGPITMAAIRKAGNDEVSLYLADRALFYIGLAGFARFGRGWIRRLFTLLMEASR